MTLRQEIQTARRQWEKSLVCTHEFTDDNPPTCLKCGMTGQRVHIQHEFVKHGGTKALA